MKAFLQTLVCCLIFAQLHAQHDKAPSIKNEWTTFKTADQKSAVNLMQDKSTLKLAQNDQLTLFSTKDDALGYRHYRYQQTYKDVPIEGAVYLMHEKNNRVQHANGKLVRDLNMSVTPTLPEATALQSALEHINATLYAWNDPVHKNLKKQVEACEDATFYPTSDLVIIDPKFGEKAEQYRLAYKFDIYAVEPLTRSVMYVDAHTGAILTTMEKIHDCTNAAASGTTNYSGNQSFTACQVGGTHTLANTVSGGMQVFNANNTQGFPQDPITDPDNFFNDDPTANEVHWATQKTYEYFLNTHGRNSLDGSGMTLLSWVHYRSNYNNAFWNGSWMTYGDGDNSLFSSLTAPDVVAHEMGHGITNFSADLVYSYESGALNESFSDIFGEVAERYMRGTNDWLMGGDFTVRPGKTTLRNMSNPNDPNALAQQPDTYYGDFWYSGSGDNGGVHYNSGVQNYWFYLLSEGGSGINDNGDAFSVSGIGMAKAANIAYRNLTVYLSRNSQYADARTGAIQAAIDLYGAGSDEAVQTEAAWCAVGVGTCDNTPPPPPSGNCSRLQDSLTLVEIYNLTDGPNWGLAHARWNLNLPMDLWFGVTLNSNGCVTALHLNSRDIEGNIPIEISNLNELTELGLAGNEFTGTIPPEIGNLTKLTFLGLSTNRNLTGTIPEEIGNLINLERLHAYNCDLTGPIPTEIGNLHYLKELYLHLNRIDGNIPPEIGNLVNLNSLMLDYNELTGNIPTELSNLSNLKELTLNQNNLTGNLPQEICYLNNLTRLSLGFNQLSGLIPMEIDNLNSLTILELQHNNFVGEIPSEIGNLSNLIDLWLGYNNLSGMIPTSIGNLGNLQVLALSSNNLTGSLPSEIANLNNLYFIWINYNQLSGCFDDSYTNLCGQIYESYNTNHYINNNNNFSANWEDFCLNGTGSCNNATVYPVWPGDFNNDGTVSNTDILQWGIAEGNTGYTRPNATTAWIAQDCQDWPIFINNINSKHADGDGDGAVDANDISVFVANYDNTHTITPYTFTETPLQFRLEAVSSTINSGVINTIYELYVESPLGTQVNTHGIACSIDFGNLLINNITLDVAGSVLQPDEHIDIFDAANNVLNIALTRTDKNNQLCDGALAQLIVISDDIQGGDPFEFRIDNGKTMAANGILTDVIGSVQTGFLPEIGIFGNDFSASVSATYSQCNDVGEATAEPVGGTTPYTYAWSTGATTASVSDLPVGVYSLTVTEANGLSQVIDFETQWTFTPVEVTTGTGQICINFDNAPLTQVVQVSLDNGATYESPITANTCYNIAAGTHHVWIQRVADQCPVDLGTVTVNDGGSSCRSHTSDANLVAIGGQFGQFAEEEFIKNFLTAEKGYIRYQAEIHRILESKDERYKQVNQDFDKIKDMAMTMLFQSFVSKRPVTVTDKHIKAIDNFLLSLSQATSKGKLRNEITKVRQHLHVIESKEVKDALIAFDRAGATDTSDITPFDTPDQDEFDVQLLNTAGRESRVTYNIVKQGIINMSLYNTHGQQVRTLHNGISYEGHHQIPIDKNGLPPGIYFIHIEYIVDGVPINKILKLPVMK